MRKHRKDYWFVVLIAGVSALASALALALAFDLTHALPALAAQTVETATAGRPTDTGATTVSGTNNAAQMNNTKSTAGPNAGPTTASATKTSSSSTSASGKTSSTNEAEIDATVEPPREDGQTRQAKATLTIRLTVPLMKKRTDTFTIYPYTIAPQKIAIQVPPLPDKDYALKIKILNSGYNNRLSLTKPYPQDGWRWHYAYDRARKKSGIGEPHVFFQMNHFVDDLMPYVIPECRRINKIEAQRKKTYDALKESYIDNHKDEEMEALRLGLEPIPMNLVPIKRGDSLETSLFISPGDWWITGSHRVPGLVYFWQEPVKVHDGDNIVKELNEDNAILVQGGW